jgi:TRAP-type C4-dicarboxylate transport system permease large subunit
MTTSISGVSLEKLSATILPFVLWMVAVVILMIFFPALTLWLPKVLGFI